MSEYIFNKTAASSVSAPASGKGTVFMGTDGKYYSKDGDTGQTAVISVTGLNRNYLINGGFNFAQRQAPGTLTSYNSATARLFGADRWGMVNATASVQFQRLDTLGGVQAGLDARYYGLFKQITGAGKVAISQVIEGVSGANLRGTAVRVQCKMKQTAGTAATMRLGLVELTAAGTIDTIPATFMSAFGASSVDPTLGTNLAYIAPTAGTATGGTIAGNAVSCVLGSGWAQYTAQFTVPVGTKNLIMVIWSNANLAINDEINVAECGLYVGTDIQDWVEMPLQVELANCQRYCSKSFAIDTAPVQNGGVVGAISGIAGKAGATALGGNIYVQFPVGMRGNPTVTIYCPTEASAHIDRVSGTTPIAHTATAQLHLGDNSVLVTSTGTTNTAVGDIIALHYMASAEI